MKKITLIMFVFASLVFCPSDGQSLEVGENAPDFNLVDVAGDKISLSAYKGKKNVILIFYEDNS